MTKLIGFAGFAGSGKTFAAATLVSQAGFTRARFADPLKDMAKALGLSHDQVDGHLKETPTPILCGRTPRYALQTLGTEWGRDLIGPGLWIDAWRRRVVGQLIDGYSIVVDDVRFINEIDEITRLGGKVYWVHRDGVRRGDHVSEMLSPEACHDGVYNSGDETNFTQIVMGLV
jgi:hypothetical protein